MHSIVASFPVGVEEPHLFREQGSLAPVRFISKPLELGGATRWPREGEACIRPVPARNRTNSFREAVQGDKAGSEFVH